MADKNTSEQSRADLLCQPPLAVFMTELQRALRDSGLEELTEKQLNQLTDHYSLLCRWNRRLNLTRITASSEAARLHYAESLMGAPLVRNARAIVDLGSGAGFPAIPLAVACSQSHITALEANQKKAIFLEEVKDKLRLENFSVAQARVEEFDLSSYDLLTCRAIDRAESVVSEVLRSLRVGQRLMFYCTLDILPLLKDSFAPHYKIKIHSTLPASSRVIIIFSNPDHTQLGQMD